MIVYVEIYNRVGFETVYAIVKSDVNKRSFALQICNFPTDEGIPSRGASVLSFAIRLFTSLQRPNLNLHTHTGMEMGPPYGARILPHAPGLTTHNSETELRSEDRTVSHFIIASAT